MGLLTRLPGVGGWREDPVWAPVYDWIVAHRRVGGALWRIGIGSDLGLLYAAASEIATLPPGARVLDVPCGGGVALRGLRPGQGASYVAADIAPAMLRRTLTAARRRGLADQVSAVVADAARLPFEDEAFDLVVSFTGLHCFPDPQTATAEMARVLRPEGVLSLSTMLTDTGRRYAPARRLGTAAGLLGPMCSRAELEAWLAEDGVGEVGVRLSGVMGYFRGVRERAAA